MSFRPRIIRPSAAAVAALLAVASLGTGPGLAQSSDQEQFRKPAPTPEQEAETRQRLLDSLLARLSKAENAEAAKLAEEAVWALWMRSGSPTVDALMGQAVKAMGAERRDAALTILDAVVDLAPGYAEGWNKRATLLYLDAKLERSRSDVERTLELEPRHFGALSGLGLILRAQGDAKGALDAFRRALEIHPFLAGARNAADELEKDVDGRGI